MSVKRRDPIRFLEGHGFYLLREGGSHSIYTNGVKTIPVKRHKTLDRITPMKSASKPDFLPSFSPPL